MGAWRLRSDYQYTRSDTEAGSEQNGRFSRVYMFRPLPSIGAKLTLGETDFQSSIFDAFTYTGASLISDERMLPWSLRGYAPQITGIAQTNATVAVSLADRVIYQSKVPPGPFVIQDLNQSVQGTLDVKVTEEDGRVNTFQVSAESVPFLTRKGQVRYKLAAGKARQGASHDVEDNAFMSGEFSWGMLSHTSLYGGTLADGDRYRSVAAGIGQNMAWLGRSLLTSRRLPASCHTSAARRVTAIALTTASVSIPPAVSLRSPATATQTHSFELRPLRIMTTVTASRKNKP